MTRPASDAADARDRLASDIALQILDAPLSERADLLAAVALIVVASLSPEPRVQFGAVEWLSVTIRRALMRRHAKRAA